MTRIARSLDTLRTEVNAAAPRRSKASDGWIGDPAHASRDSDHNPNAAGVVRALDLTDDPAGGLDCDVLAERLAAMMRLGAHPALASGAYIIWDRRILSRDRIREGWRPYSGANPHTKHLHLSAATAPSGYDSVQPWGFKPPSGPKRVARYLAETKTELGRLRKARAAARRRGYPVEPYRKAIKKLRASRRAAKGIR